MPRFCCLLHLQWLAFSNVLIQDKRWLNKGETLVTLVKDGDDARNLVVVVVMVQACVDVTMVWVGLVWGVIRGWQLA